MAHDLIAIAQANSAARKAAADALVATDPSGRLAAIRDAGASAALSTNVDAAKVRNYDAAGGIVPTPRPISGADPWRARREAFEDMWQHGHQFVYGAVNIGNMGAEDFGSFCIVVADPATPAPDALGTFPADSAQRYVSTAAVVDEPRALHEATGWADRGPLTVTERAHEALVRPTGDWPDVVCEPGRYLEVVRAGPLPLTAVSQVRLRATRRTELDKLQARRHLLGATLSARQRHDVAAYDVVQGWRRSLGVSVVDVP